MDKCLNLQLTPSNEEESGQSTVMVNDCNEVAISHAKPENQVLASSVKALLAVAVVFGIAWAVLAGMQASLLAFKYTSSPSADDDLWRNDAKFERRLRKKDLSWPDLTKVDFGSDLNNELEESTEELGKIIEVLFYYDRMLDALHKGCSADYFVEQVKGTDGSCEGPSLVVNSLFSHECSVRQISAGLVQMQIEKTMQHVLMRELKAIELYEKILIKSERLAKRVASGASTRQTRIVQVL